MTKRTALLTLFLLSSTSVFAQVSSSDGALRSAIVLQRHGVRAPIESETRSGVFNAQPWPKWPVEPGLLTPHGIEALKRMGEFYRQRYNSLLTPCGSVAVESTNTVRTIGSAKVMMSVLAPGCDVPVKTDLTADPPDIDKAKLQDAINGRMANQPEWFTRAFARPLDEMHDVLTKCTACKEVLDFRTMMIEPDAQAPSMMQPGAAHAKATVVKRDARNENAVALGADLAENFLLQYVEGMPMSQVGWGRVSRKKLDDLMEMNTSYHDFILRTPYYAQQAAGPLAVKIGDLLRAAAAGGDTPRFVFLSAHDGNLTWMGGLLGLNWIVSDETLNATPPGSALVFELRCPNANVPNRSDRSDTCNVRALFIAQTLDQIRNLTPLTGAEKPSIAPIFIPGCSGKLPDYACTVKDFTEAVSAAVNQK